MTAVAPCVHPRCRDAEGNARLTTQTICEPCRNHLRREIGWLRDDYYIIKAFMPRPAARTNPTRKTSTPTYGHPNEWATDTCRLIAKEFNRIEDDLREEMGDEPPPNIHTAPEAHLVERGHRYLTARFHDLCDRDQDIATDASVTIHELHATIRRTLGYNKQIQRLEGVPCPTCDVAALVRSVHQIDCEQCGRIIPEEKYPLLTRIVLDEKLDDLIATYDAQHAG